MEALRELIETPDEGCALRLSIRLSSRCCPKGAPKDYSLFRHHIAFVAMPFIVIESQ
jgi:hypothetical protein